MPAWKKALYAAILLTLPFAAALGGSMVSKQQQQADAAALSDAMALVDQVSVAPAAAESFGEVQPFDLAQATNAEEIKGKPLNAPKVDDESIPKGSPIVGPDGDVPPGTAPIRTISPEAWELMKQAEGPADPNNLNFEKTPDGKFTKVTFSALGSYPYELPDPEKVRNAPEPAKAVGDQIPKPIKELEGQPAVVVGFMVPIEINRDGRVKSFALTQNQTFCCYGVPPAMNEWIMVEMEEDKTADFKLDLPVATYGKLNVGEEIEDGYVLSIYRMEATEVIDAHELLKRAEGQ